MTPISNELNQRHAHANPMRMRKIPCRTHQLPEKHTGPAGLLLRRLPILFALFEARGFAGCSWRNRNYSELSGRRKIVAGKELVECTRVKPDGMFRFSTSCCNTPIANTQPGRPWAGFHRRMFSKAVEESLGPVKSSIMGKYAKGTPPPRTPQTFDFKGMKLVLPYILKGILLGKAKHSPFFANGEAIVPPEVLSADERQAARAAAGV